MTLHLHNTLTRRKEAFAPIDPDHVRVYVCGPTVYDYAHVGNARPVIVFDVLARLLRRLYPRVTYVRNITDVEDKIIAAARENGEPIDALTARTTEIYHADMAALGALPPDVEPRATQHIDEMIDLIGRLIDGGHAYEAEGHVLFHVPSMTDYGALSGRNRDEQISGARVEVAPYKRDPADFVLWKPSTAEQPGWDSPWGHGRPGWHIECSAMAAKHLGEVFDIHGGGVDLVFPHHENEIAQSRCALGTPALARYWMHNGFVTVGSEKMAKSLGNFTTVHDLLGRFPGEAIRLTLLSAHYRQPLDVGDDAVARSRAQLDRIYGALRSVRDLPPPEGAPEEPAGGVMAALLDDLNTPLAISALHDLVGRLNKAETEDARRQAKAALADAGAVLGIGQDDPETWFRWQPPGSDDLDDDAVADLIAARQAARKARDFGAADRIRDDLAEKGIVLEDTPQGTIWRRG